VPPDTPGTTSAAPIMKPFATVQITEISIERV
jgi:hypothetical protein